MTNRMYIEGIINLIKTCGNYIGCSKTTKQVKPCMMISCENCLFYNKGEDCQKYAEEWLDKEFHMEDYL